jgi:hypothetical protein
MKIIEGLKKIKDLQRKADDLREKIAKHSAHLNYETPVYADQKGQVAEWLQAHSDILKEVMGLRIAIQRTNLETNVTIELGDKAVTKTIAEWIHRRRDLASHEVSAYKQLTDRGLREGIIQESTGEKKEITIVRCYDPTTRDEKINLYESEPTTIDSKLEVVNAITDLMV